MATPDPKPPKRIVDRQATTRACLTYRTCGICGHRSETGHHVISRKQGGDDVLANIVPLCGSGTTGCHGRIENEEIGARKVLGAHLVENRPDVIEYVREKLGPVQAHDWLRRRLYVSLVTPSEEAPA